MDGLIKGLHVGRQHLSLLIIVLAVCILATACVMPPPLPPSPAAAPLATEAEPTLAAAAEPDDTAPGEIRIKLIDSLGEPDRDVKLFVMADGYGTRDVLISDIEGEVRLDLDRERRWAADVLENSAGDSIDILYKIGGHAPPVEDEDALRIEEYRHLFDLRFEESDEEGGMAKLADEMDGEYVVQGEPLVMLADAMFGMFSGVSANMEIVKGEPKLNEPFTVRLEVKPQVWSDDVDIFIDLPTGIEAVDAETQWKTSFKQDVSQVYTTTLVAVENGYYTLHGTAHAEWDNGDWSNGDAFLYLSVEDDDSWYSRIMPQNYWEQRWNLKGLPTQAEQAEDFADTQLTVQGDVLKHLADENQTIVLASSDPFTVRYDLTPLVDFQGAVSVATPFGGVQDHNERYVQASEEVVKTHWYGDEKSIVFRWAGIFRQGESYTFEVQMTPTHAGDGWVQAGIDEQGPGDGVDLRARSDALYLQYYPPRLLK